MKEGRESESGRGEGKVRGGRVRREKEKWRVRGREGGWGVREEGRKWRVREGERRVSEEGKNGE